MYETPSELDKELMRLDRRQRNVMRLTAYAVVVLIFAAGWVSCSYVNGI
jgi:hypothetical protein